MNINRLKKLVEQSDKTINQIQNDANLKSGQLYRILNGTNKDITLTTAFKLADALGVDINEFREEWLL